MRNTRSLLIAVTVLLVAAAMLGPGASSAWAGMQLFETWGPGNYGGEFWCNSVGSPPIPYVTGVKPPGYQFIAFCCETGAGHEIGNNVTANVEITTWADGAAPDPLDAKTAYLFHQFNWGALPGYRYGGTYAERTSDADQLQFAMWYIEQEPGYGLPAPGTKARTWYDAAVAAGWTDIGQVRVLHLTNAQGAGLQDMIFEQVPEPGTLAFLSFGMMGALPFLRRRKRA